MERTHGEKWVELETLENWKTGGKFRYFHLAKDQIFYDFLGGILDVLSLRLIRFGFIELKFFYALYTDDLPYKQGVLVDQQLLTRKLNEACKITFTNLSLADLLVIDNFSSLSENR